MSHGRWALVCGLCTALLTVLLLGVDGRQHRIDERAELGYRSELLRLEGLAAELDRELLRCRSGLTPHHDDLRRVFGELRGLQERLVRAPAGLGFMPGPELSAALLRVSALGREQQQALERFETANVALRSARQALPSPLEALRARAQALPGSELLSAYLTTLLSALASLDVLPLPDALVQLNAGLNGLERTSLAWAADVAPLLQQGRAIAESAPVVDALTMQLLTLPLGAAIRAALEGYQQSHREAVGRAQLRGVLLTVFTALAVLLGLWLVLL